MTLSRRDRAAMVYAYECLRAMPSDSPMAALVDADDALNACRAAGAARVLSRDVQAAWHHVSRARLLRVARARLALLLRVLLRADAGDFGPVECTGCGDGGWRFDRAGQRCSGCDIEHWQTTRELDSEARYERVRFTPLWETAPAHRGER